MNRFLTITAVLLGSVGVVAAQSPLQHLQIQTPSGYSPNQFIHVLVPVPQSGVAPMPMAPRQPTAVTPQVVYPIQAFQNAKPSPSDRVASRVRARQAAHLPFPPDDAAEIERRNANEVAIPVNPLPQSPKNDLPPRPAEAEPTPRDVERWRPRLLETPPGTEPPANPLPAAPPRNSLPQTSSPAPAPPANDLPPNLIEPPQTSPQPTESAEANEEEIDLISPTEQKLPSAAGAAQRPVLANPGDPARQQKPVIAEPPTEKQRQQPEQSAPQHANSSNGDGAPPSNDLPQRSQAQPRPENQDAKPAPPNKLQTQAAEHKAAKPDDADEKDNAAEQEQEQVKSPLFFDVLTQGEDPPTDPVELWTDPVAAPCLEEAACPTKSVWGASVEAWLPQRDRISDRVLATNAVGPVLTVDEIDFDVDAAVRFRLFRALDGDGIWSFSYLQSLGFAETATIASAAGDLASIAGTTDFAAADWLKADYRSRLYGFELTRYELFSERFGLLAGLRHIAVEESFELRSRSAAGGTVSTFAADADNHLFGGEIGAGWNLPVQQRDGVEAIFKSGVYWRDSNADRVLRDVDDAVLLANQTASDDDVAYTIDFSLSYFRYLGERLRLRAGYAVLWIDDLALAPRQMPTAVPFAPAIDTNSGAFYHGATVSLDAAW